MPSPGRAHLTRYESDASVVNVDDVRPTRTFQLPRPARIASPRCDRSLVHRVGGRTRPSFGIDIGTGSGSAAGTWMTSDAGARWLLRFEPMGEYLRHIGVAVDRS